MRHKIYVKNKTPAPGFDPRDIRDAVTFTLDAEGADARCEVSVTVTDDAGIRAVNREYRKKDAATDVLSFPLQTFAPGAFDARTADTDMDTGRIPLGDIVLSYERVLEQAREYGNTPARELTYLTVHSVLHLLGYDHADEGAEKARMRAREKEIMRRLGYEEV